MLTLLPVGPSSGNESNRIPLPTVAMTYYERS